MPAMMGSGSLICMTLHSFHIGGCELQLLSLCKELKKRNIDVIVLYSYSAGAFYSAADKTPQFFYIPPFFYKFRLISVYLSFLFRWKIKRYPSIFHCHSIGYFSEQILWFAQKKNIPCLLKVTTEGHIDLLKEQIQQRPTLIEFLKALVQRKHFQEKRSALEKLIFGRKRLETYSKVEKYLSINPNIDQELRQFPIEKKQIFSIHNAVNPNRFKPISKQDKVRLKEELNLPKDSKFITMVARFVERKRIEDLILAWSHIAKRFPDYNLLLVGDGPLKETYKHQITELGLTDRVIFTGFQLNTEKFFQITDIFAFSSEREGLPNVLLEAMSSQLPIVASSISGVKEIITPFENELLFPPKDVLALRDSLIYMLTHLEEALSMSVAAREKILKLYSFEATTPKFISLYHEVQKLTV